MSEPHDPYAALRFADYRRLLVGNVLRSMGTEMQSVAVGWELYQRTNSAAALGMVGLVQFVPVVLLALPAGQAVDRSSPKRYLLTAQLLMALTSAGLAVLSAVQGPVGLVYLCLFLAGVSQAINAPARWAILPMLVPETVLGNAITWNSSGWQVASMAGPALGGLVMTLVQPAATGLLAHPNVAPGAFWVYLIAFGSCLTVTALFVFLRPRPAERSSEPISWRSLAAGIGFVRRTRLILATITLDLFAVLLGGATALLPIYARDILAVGPAGLGWLRASPSIGAFCMAIGLAHRPPLRRAGRALLWAVAGFGVATIVFGLSRSPLLSFAALALTGALDNISIVVRGTLVQVLTPDPMRGRVAAVNSIFITSSNELGAFESGITAQWFGPTWSVVGGGIGTLVVVLATMWAWPEILRLGPLDRPEVEDAALEPVAEVPPPTGIGGG